MPTRNLDPNNLSKYEDWEGNNASFKCPHCDKVFIVSEMIHKGVRACPECGRSIGKCKGGKKSGGTASLEW
jgi:predicted RNA-binding Zn-ribbon protein involved in translation (DUF1610 family)